MNEICAISHEIVEALDWARIASDPPEQSGTLLRALLRDCDGIEEMVFALRGRAGLMIVTAEISKLTGLAEGTRLDVSPYDFIRLKSCLAAIQDCLKQVSILEIRASVLMAQVEGLFSLVERTIPISPEGDA